MSLQTELKQAKEKLISAKDALEASKEQKDYNDALKKVYEIEKLIKQEEEFAKQRQFEAQKLTLIKLGFECRNGHETGASNHHDRTSNAGEPYTFVITHQARPVIRSIFEWSDDISVYWNEEEDSNNENWILGHGETELEAWEDAVDNIDYDNCLDDALEGLTLSTNA